MKNIYKKTFLSVFAFVLAFSFLPINYANAGVCGDIVVLKDGKAVKETGSVKIPAKDKSKWQLKIITNRTRAACTDDYAKVSLVYIDATDKRGPTQEIVAEQKIGTGTEINKTIELKTSDPAGTYRYSLDSRKDLTTTTITSNGLAIVLGDAGTGSTGAGGNINTTVGTKFETDLDESIGSFWNPLEGSVENVPQLVTGLIRIMFALIGIIAVVIIIISGFRMVLASGNEEELTKAKKAITWAIVGLIVSLLSFSIVAIIQRLIQVGAN